MLSIDDKTDVISKGASIITIATYHVRLPSHFVDAACRNTEDLGWENLQI